MSRMRFSSMTFSILLVGWGLLVTVRRALRLPNDWSESHWLINYYEFGFMKRALPGSVMATFIDPLADPLQTLHWIQVSAFACLLLFIGTVAYGAIHILRCHRFSTESWLMVLLFITSPWIVMMTHLVGYFDLMIFLFATGAMALAVRGWVWSAALLLAIGLLVHEILLLVGLPSVAFAVLFREANKTGNNQFPSFWWQQLKTYYPVLLLPAVMFVVIFARHLFFIDDGVLQQKIEYWLNHFDFIASNLRLFLSTSFIMSFADHYEASQGRLWVRFGWGGFLLKTGLPVLAVLWFCWKRLSQIREGKILFFFLLAIIVLPLSLHLIGQDSSRFWSYPFAVAFWAVWVCSDATPGDTSLKLPDRLWSLSVALLVIWQMFSRIPLMDYSEEGFSNPLRLALYSPLIIWMLWCLYREVSRHHGIPR